SRSSSNCTRTCSRTCWCTWSRKLNRPSPRPSPKGEGDSTKKPPPGGFFYFLGGSPGEPAKKYSFPQVINRNRSCGGDESMTLSRLTASGSAAVPPNHEEKITIMPSAPAGSERFARGAPGDASIESLRLPPHSVEAEQAVLGGLLLQN